MFSRHDAGSAIAALIASGQLSVSSHPEALQRYAEEGRKILAALLVAVQGASKDDQLKALSDSLREPEAQLHVGTLHHVDPAALTQLEADLRAASVGVGDTNHFAKRVRQAANHAGDAIAEEQARQEAARRERKRRQGANAGAAAGMLTLIEGDKENAEVFAILADALATHPELYVRGGAYVSVKQSPAPVGRSPLPPRAEVLSYGQAVRCICDRIRFVQSDDPDAPPCPPWAWAITPVMGEANPKGRPLEAIVSCPTLRPDGSILDTPGYDEVTGVLYLPPPGSDPLRLSIPNPGPNFENAAKALGTLTDLVDDFCFENAQAQSVWLAFVLTLVSRYATQGLKPMTAIDATTPGSGKSLLLDLACLIANGRKMERFPEVRDDEAFGKKITAKLIEGADLLLLDNLKRPLGGANLDQLLTGESWTDRILNASRTGSWWNTIIFAATGNNLQLSDQDMLRRVMVGRLVPDTERPQGRSFRITNIERHVQQHQALYLSAAITIVRSYILEGQPGDHPRLGSFQEWSDLIRGALLWLGCADPWAERSDLDPSTDQLRRLLASWAECFGVGTKMKLSDVRRRFTDRNADLETSETLLEFWTIANELDLLKGNHPDTGRLGRYLRSHRDKWVAGRVFRADTGGRVALWRVEEKPKG